jgi:hypothetical protein
MNNFDEHWVPRPSDMAWTAAQIDRVKDGGSMIFQADQSIWIVDKTHKVIRCVSVGVDKTMHHAVRACVKPLGYTVEVVASPPVVIGKETAGTVKTQQTLPRIATDHNQLS